MPGFLISSSLPFRTTASQIESAETPRLSSAHRLGRGLLRRGAPERLQQRPGRARVGLAGLPVVADLAGVLEVGLVRPDGDGARIAVEVEQAEGQRAEDRLGVLPADGLQGPPALRGEDGLVADVALIADPQAPERLHGLGRPRGPAERGDRRVGRVGVPGLHRPDELRLGLARPGEACLVHLAERPVPFLDVLRLRGLEVVERPEQGEQPVVLRGGLPQQVRRVDDEDGVELEADRVRLHVADAGQEEGRQQVPVREPLLQVPDGHLERPLAGRLLDPAHDRLDLRAEPDRVGADLQVRRPCGRDHLQPGPVPQARPQPDRRSRLQEPTPPQLTVHRGLLEGFSPSPDRNRTQSPVSLGVARLATGESPPAPRARDPRRPGKSPAPPGIRRRSGPRSAARRG